MALKKVLFPLICLVATIAVVLFGFFGNPQTVSSALSSTGEDFRDARALMADPRYGQLVTGKSAPAQNADPAFAHLALSQAPSSTTLDLLQVLSSAQSRVPGYPGYEQTSQALINIFNGIFGAENVHVEEYPVTVPITSHCRVILPQSGQRMEEGLHPLWPFGVKLQSFEGGFAEAPVVDGGDGQTRSLDGKTIKDAIVLLNFDSDDAYLRVRQLGARAVILLHRGDISYNQALKKFCSAPIDAPLFYATPAMTQTLLQAAQSSQTLRIETRSEWREVTARNIWGRFPGLDEPLPVKKPKWSRKTWDENTLLVNAFYDSMSIVPAIAPGASSSAGLLTLIESARHVRAMRDSGQPNRHALVFLANGAHYLGHEGFTNFMLKHARGEKHSARRQMPPEDRIEPRLILSLETTDADPRVVVSQMGVGIAESPFYRHEDQHTRSGPWLQRLIFHFRDLGVRINGSGQERFMDGVKPSGRNFRSLMPIQNEFTYDSDVGLWLSYPSAPLTTPEDPRPLVDTPVDTFDRFNISNVFEQARSLAPVIHATTLDAEFFERMQFPAINPDRGVGLSGRVVWYDVKSNFSTPVGRIGEGGMAVTSTINSHIGTRHGVRVDLMQKLRFNEPSDGNEREGYEARLNGETAWRLHLSKTLLGDLAYVNSAELNHLPVEANFVDAQGVSRKIKFEGTGTEYFAEIPRDARGVSSVVLASGKGSRVLFSDVPLHDARIPGEHFELKVGTLRYAKLEVWSRQLQDAPEVAAQLLLRGPQTLRRPMQPDAEATARRGQPTFSVKLDSEALGVREVVFSRGGNDKTLFANIPFEDTFRFPIIMQALQSDWARAKVECYRVNYDGAVDFATDQGQQGTQTFPNNVYKISGVEEEMLLVMFPCRSVTLLDIVDPRYLRALDVMRLLSPNDSEPIRFSQSIALKQSVDERHVPLGAVAFLDPDMPLKMIMSSDFFGIKYLLINTPDRYVDPKYLKLDGENPRTQIPEEVRDLTFDGYPSDMSIILNPGYQVARDLWLLDESRARKLARYGVRNERLDELHANAYAELVKAKTALERKDYSEHFRATHEAWGLEARAYPDVKGTAIDTVKGIIFYFALLLPFSFFMERLLFGFSDFRKQIAGLCLMFAIAFIVLRVVHPAFKITDSPYVILLAFIILALGVIVTLTISLKFRTEIQKMKSEESGIVEADVGRLSATYSAVILGVSNLRKRKVRTALTATTVCLLTFTVLSFTSVTHQLDFWRIPIDNTYSPYVGAMVRDRNYRVMQPQTYTMVKEAFEGRANVLRRNWMVFPFTYPELGYYELTNPDTGDKAIANAFTGLEPAERELPVGYQQTDDSFASGPIEEILLPGSRWFSPQEASANVLLLPQFLAKSLKIDIGAIKAGTARVQLFHEEYKVIGIIDEARAATARFIDNEPITPLDMSSVPREARENVLRSNPAESGANMIKVMPHLTPRAVAIMPYERLEKFGYGPRHIAVYGFKDATTALDEIKDFMRRVSLAVYVGDGNTIQVYSTMGSPSFSGLGKLFIPILIVAALVMNTMMGAVYERFKEIGIYSSVGLAPNHIGALFLAESFVFATVGAVIGYLISQALAFILSSANLLSGINLNYSSLSAVLATLIVMATVLASSLYPARKASQMAVPDVTRRWKIAPPDGDTWKFVFPFTIAGGDVAGLMVFLRDYFQAYIDNSVADFFTQNVQLQSMPAENSPANAYRLSMNVWLAPYDMSISQSLTLDAVPTDYHNVYEVHVTLQRRSGEIGSWIKMNHRFLNVLRKRFLLWRTIPQPTKDRYAAVLTKTAPAS